MTAPDFILPSFFGDALALGPHWIYDSAKISGLYPGAIRDYDKPRSSYHPGKSAGDLTHLGDQTLALLESLASTAGALGEWPADWRSWAERARDEKSSYLDGATHGTLENLAAGRKQPSDSSDLAGAARIAPLFAVHGDVVPLVAAARAQTSLTHGDARVIDAAEFFSRATFAVGEGAEFAEAFEEAAFFPYAALPASDWLMVARHVSGDLTGQAGALGLGCDIAGAFPITLALALRHEGDPAEALSANAMLGGDSAARGLLLGLLMGARHGLAAFPASWTDRLQAGETIHRALERLPSP
jgi:ADP-ribosylglycohydrolase